MLTLRNAIAAITMAVAALCGGGKAVAEQKGTLSVSEVRAAPALRSKSQTRDADLVAVVPESEVGVDEHQNDVRAAADDRATFVPVLATVLFAADATRERPFISLATSLRESLRPPVRAPPAVAVNGLAVRSGRA